MTEVEIDVSSKDKLVMTINIVNDAEPEVNVSFINTLSDNL